MKENPGAKDGPVNISSLELKRQKFWEAGRKREFGRKIEPPPRRDG